MNTNAFVFTVAVLTFGFTIFNFFARKIQLKKIKREKEYLEELEDVTHKMNMHMVTLLMHHDYRPEEITDMLLEGVKRHKFDERIASAAFTMYNSFEKFIDSARENGIIK
jgi:hypothetical protein